NATEFLVYVCLGFSHVVSGRRSKSPGKLRLSRGRSRPRVPCDREPGMIGRGPFDGSLFIFRGKRGDYFKAIYWDGTGLWLLAKKLETGRFVWPPIVDGAMTLSPTQLAVLIEAMDWRRTVTPEPPRRPM